MTSLIDVIFLLLLFFMLTSTFSKFGEVELAAGASGSAASAEVRPVFVQLGADSLSLNARDLTLDDLARRLNELAGKDGETIVLVSLKGDVSSQRLTDLLVAVRPVQGISLTVLGS